MAEPVSVAGIGLVSPFGTTHSSFTDALLSGRSAISPIAGFDVRDCHTTLAAEAAGFVATDWVHPMKLRRMDRTGAYALAVTRLVFDDAQHAPAAEGDSQTGVVLGTWTAGGQSTQQYLDALLGKGPAAAPALLFESTVGNAAASVAAMEFKLKGPNATLSHKEASGLAAIVASVDLLRARRACALVAGGVDAVYETFFKAHDRFRVMSAAPAFSHRLAPFDAERSGFVLGEGGFALWLELETAGAARHGQILGAAASSAPVGLNAWPDAPEPLVRTMRLALDDAGLAAKDVDVVYASANATTTLDATEAAALTALFGRSRTVVTSIKGAIGESGLTGTAACIAALLCGRRGQVPPIAGLASPDPAAADLQLATTPRAAPGPIALVNSFASGGALFSVVLRTAPAADRAHA